MQKLQSTLLSMKSWRIWLEVYLRSGIRSSMNLFNVCIRETFVVNDSISIALYDCYDVGDRT